MESPTGNPAGERRIFFGHQHWLYALDANTGQQVKNFGDAGRVDLRVGLGRDPQEMTIGLTTPGVIYQDLLIVGSIVNEGLPAAPGHIRAYDVRTGAVAMDISYHSATGRVWLRDVAEGCVEVHRGREQLGRDGAGRQARPGLCPDGVSSIRFLWGEPARGQFVREYAAVPGREDGQTKVAFSNGAARRMGS